MQSPAAHPRHPLVAAWVAQMVGTLVLAAAVLAFMRSMSGPLSGENEWRRYAMAGILLMTAPALVYLRTFKARLDEDERQVKQRGTPEPATRAALTKGLAFGGALCELPQALGVVYLFLGGETRWFLAATLVTIALRLSYRPFTRIR
jgi:hypothetical protein